MAEFLPVGDVADFPPGKLILRKTGDDPVVVINLEGSFYAFGNYCPHAGQPLVDGYVMGKEVMCAYHMETFDMTTGQSESRSCPNLLLYGLKVEDGQVFVEDRGVFHDTRPAHLRFVSDT